MVDTVRDIVRGLQKPRTGWGLRGIADTLAETVWQHSKKVESSSYLWKTFPTSGSKKVSKDG